MASYVISFKNQAEFFQKIQDKDRDLMVKMVKTVLHAHKHKKPKIDVFEVLFTDEKGNKELVFSLERSQYAKTLLDTFDELIRLEEYELCAEIKKATDKKPSRTKSKVHSD